MKKKLVALLTAATMMVAFVPGMAMAAGDGSKSVKVNYSCSSNNSFQMVDEELTVKNDLAETVLKNDYPEVAAEEADEVTVLDVLVAAHIKKYGDAFKNKPSDYLYASKSKLGTYVEKIFKDSTGNQAFINNVGIMNASKDVVKNGDVVKSAISDPSDASWASKFTYFEKESYSATTGKEVKMPLKAIGFDSNYNPVVEKAPAYTLKEVDKQTLTMKDLNGSVDADGIATISFAKTGIYYVSAVEKASNTMFAPIAKVTVTEEKKTEPEKKKVVKLAKVKITKKKGGKKKATLKWKKVAGAKEYQVYKSTKKNGKFKKAATVKKTKATVKKLKKGKTYYFKVRALAKNSGKVVKGAFSKTVKVKVK